MSKYVLIELNSKLQRIRQVQILLLKLVYFSPKPTNIFIQKNGDIILIRLLQQNQRFPCYSKELPK